MIGTATVIRGDALHIPLPDNSVDLICTSPPYFGLRSYQDAGAHYTGQIGSEATPAEFLDALLAATREMVRVLKPSGSLFVNLGDKYAGMANQRERRSTQPVDGGAGTLAKRPETTPQNVSFGRIRDKSLMGIPWRYAIRCIDTTQGVPVPIVREMVAAVYNGNLDPYACDEILKEYETGGRNAGLELILRAEIIWNKPNGLPESVTDRVRRSHEQWFHFTKQPRYFAAVDEIRETYDTADRKGDRSSYRPGQTSGNTLNGHSSKSDAGLPLNPLGKLPGSVWTVPTQPLEVPPELGIDHFAAYPMEWPRRIIQGWTPAGICVECGEGRRPVSERSYETLRGSSVMGGSKGLDASNRWSGMPVLGTQTTITGYSCGCTADPCWIGKPDCATCLPPTRPAVVLDPFGGTGTTALVAKALGRHGITIDLSADYCRLAEWRCNDHQQLAQALQVEKPDVIPPGQLALFD